MKKNITKIWEYIYLFKLCMLKFHKRIKKSLLIGSKWPFNIESLHVNHIYREIEP